MHLTLQIDTTDAEDLRAARATIDTLLKQLAVPVVPEPTTEALVAALRSVTLMDKPRANRHGYLRRIAEAGDKGADVERLRNEHFKGSHQSYGGTHAAIERSWHANGGKAFAPQLIRETDDGRQIMLAEARPILLDLVRQMDQGE